MLTVSFRLGYAEHRRALVALAGGPAAGRANVVDLLPVFFAAVGIFVALQTVSAGGDGVALVSALTMPLLFGAGYAWVARKRPGVAFRFDDGGFTRSFGGRERRAAWGEVAAAEEGEFFLFRAADEGWYVPRRALDEAGRARLREWMAAASTAPSVDDERERDDSR